ncbi:MAG: VWA domain-containing protein, partial [Chloroflexi bacterium]
MPTPLNLTPTLNSRYLPITDQPRLLYLLLEVSGGSEPASLPVNLALVVDVSESMHIRLASDEQFQELARGGMLREVLVDGVPAWQPADTSDAVLARLPRKIDRVRDALRTVVEELRSNDRFSLVAFAGRAVTLIPNTGGADKRRLVDVLDRLETLQLGDDTYIGRGMALGLQELRRGAEEGVADRLLVLTDGFTQDEDDCRAWAARALQFRIPVSTMGLGGEFNEELMIPIADQTGGEAYLLEEADDVPAAFARELQRAQAVRYRN